MKADSPITYVKPGLPPYLLIQGSADETVPPGQTLAFCEKLKQAGVQCDLLMIPEGQHRLSGWAKCDLAWQVKLVAWLNGNLMS